MSTTQRGSAANVEDMVKDFVATRPRRPRSGRVVAGVAAGIGRRYGIDPVIVRVALVVSAIYGGAGLLFYLLGWLCLAAEEDEVSPAEALLNRGRSSTSKGFALLLCILLIPSGNFVFGGHYSTIAGVAVLLAGLYLLHRYRGDQGQIDTPVESTTPTAEKGGPMTDTGFGEPAGAQDAVPPQDTVRLQDAVPTEQAPPAWDPLGAAPFAWDLPEPTPPTPTPQPPPVRRRRSRVGLATLGTVLVTGAVLGVVDSQSSWLNGSHIVGILCAIVGVGLVVGSFTRSGRGLIPLAVLLSVAAFGLTTTHFDGWHGSGDTEITPLTAADVQPVYQRSLGDMTVDLTKLPATGGIATSVELSAGDLTVYVPRDARVQVTCSASVGDVTCLGQHDSGPNPTITTSQNADASPNRLQIVLNVQDGAGDVEVDSRG